jgi:hypothetical protein
MLPLIVVFMPHCDTCTLRGIASTLQKCREGFILEQFGHNCVMCESEPTLVHVPPLGIALLTGLAAAAVACAVTMLAKVGRPCLVQRCVCAAAPCTISRHVPRAGSLPCHLCPLPMRLAAGISPGKTANLVSAPTPANTRLAAAFVFLCKVPDCLVVLTGTSCALYCAALPCFLKSGRVFPLHQRRCAGALYAPMQVVVEIVESYDIELPLNDSWVNAVSVFKPSCKVRFEWRVVGTARWVQCAGGVASLRTLACASLCGVAGRVRSCGPRRL